MRLMSFAYTPDQLLNGSKTVTRRVGWANVKVGDRIAAVRKVMGLKSGKKPEVLCEIDVVAVRRERLDFITAADCIAEGFPHLTSAAFVAMFCSRMTITDPDAGYYAKNKLVHVRRKVRGDDIVTRIEFRIVPSSVRAASQMGLALGA